LLVAVTEITLPVTLGLPVTTDAESSVVRPAGADPFAAREPSPETSSPAHTSDRTQPLRVTPAPSVDPRP